MKEAYAGTTASELANPNMGCEVTIKMADNGVIVTARYHRMGSMDECEVAGPRKRDETYVFKSLEEALKEIPSIMSVTKAKSDDETKEKIED